MKMKPFFTVAAFFIFTAAGFAQDRNVAEPPFRPGEKLKFELKWTVIKAGEATLEVLPVETIGGVSAYHFVMTAQSTPFIDVFYKIRDRIDAYTDVNMTHSVLYKKKQLEGSTHRDEIVEFDWKKDTVQYSNFGKKREPLSLKAGAFDPLSVFYYSRFFEMKENMVIERAVTDGKKCVTGRATVVRREKIKIGEKTYDSWLLEPELKDIGGVFEKSKNAKIRLWVSADKRRIPLRIESKVIVGSFVGELISESF